MPSTSLKWFLWRQDWFDYLGRVLLANLLTAGLGLSHALTGAIGISARVIAGATLDDTAAGVSLDDSAPGLDLNTEP